MPLGRRFARTSFIHKRSRDNDSRAEHNCWHGARLPWHSQVSQWHQSGDNARVTVEDEGLVHPAHHSVPILGHSWGQSALCPHCTASPAVALGGGSAEWCKNHPRSSQSWSCLCSPPLVCPEGAGEGLEVSLAWLGLGRATEPPAPGASRGKKPSKVRREQQSLGAGCHRPHEQPGTSTRDCHRTWARAHPVANCWCCCQDGGGQGSCGWAQAHTASTGLLSESPGD